MSDTTTPQVMALHDAVRIIAVTLDQHEAEYIPDAGCWPYGGFFECGCNEHGALGPLIGPEAKCEHQAREILAALTKAGIVLSATSGSAA